MTDEEDILKDFPAFLPEIEDDLRSYLICPEKLPMHKLENVQEFWPRTPQPCNLLHFDILPPSTTLKVQRDCDSGQVIGFKEVHIHNAGENALNSTSFTRLPDEQANTSIRGTPLNLPFWPGSFPKPDLKASQLYDPIDFLNEDLLQIAPGVSTGLLFDENDENVIGFASADDLPSKINLHDNKINLSELLKSETAEINVFQPIFDTLVDKTSSIEGIEEEADILPTQTSIPIVNISCKREFSGTEYAQVLDCSKPIDNFAELIPDMAHQYPFELDTFQKQAIIQLERHNHVFVAAHTSAGKTVVAEYAIALCERHMTRSIYTSPIKALSNQKYRDFKQTFKDVGLITGDFQINPTASCLIMTTEILRSMLYCGSEVTRDIEYVIFDEVHYINDKERGHVWEQVLIMLPERVCVVLLSATVPNTIEFADWLGRTHKRVVYVVSTLHRPVPLEHFLYTGSGGPSKHNRFAILDSGGWHRQGYEQAKLSLSTSSSYVHRVSEKQEKTMWYALMDHLNSKDLLPVVVFTFSRQKCDRNAENLSNLDLTTQREKAAINRFFEQCVRSLKPPDRNIPQIVRMRDILKRGIGVHHSGILPIIKEMVEMLFQNRLVKLLFATETFAMGVNMPSRTVIFDSITKHDGRERRQLLPAEYIQMAGRAGRRGKDKKGTVIILCKGELPAAMHLQEMMLGKPSQLTSQFRITYGMVLSLLRVESLSVEGMMSRSFREVDHQKNMSKQKEKLEAIEKNLKENFAMELGDYLQPLIRFYQVARRYLDFRRNTFADIVSHPKSLKELAPGRLVVITHRNHLNKLALILSHSKKLPLTLRVMVLTSKGDEVTDEDSDEKTEFWYKMLALAQSAVFVPMDEVSHQVLTISALDLFHVSYAAKLKVDADVVLKDWDKRQIPRFRTDAPGPTCARAVQDLLKITMEMPSIDQHAGFFDVIGDLHLNEQMRTMMMLREEVYTQACVIKIPNFGEQFAIVFKKRILEDERDHLRHLISDASMALYPDYENRIQLLRRLKYVDAQNRVELKGRVACEMGMNELLLTELILRNILTKLQPAEVAALLSSIVFQAKTNVELSDLDLTPELKNGIVEIKRVMLEIQQLELEYQVYGDDMKDLNFGLVHVVYEWASDKPFADIMTMTDIQEGIIVRCIQQLNEIICDVKNAARLIGEPALQSKMEEASTAIKRDIVFAASLYTQRESGGALK